MISRIVERWHVVAIAAIVVAALAIAVVRGPWSWGSRQAAPPEPTAVATSHPTPLPPHGEPSFGASPSVPEPTLSESELPSTEPSATPRSPDPRVAEAQQTLTDHGYYVGTIDGLAGAATRSATMAFQKVHGLSADGVLGPVTYAALESPITPTLHGGDATRVEVDLTKQVAYWVEAGQLRRIFPVSSGSGETYVHSSGTLARSLTPTGAFRIQRKISGVRDAPLGILYDPMYYHRGWALHGSNHVPAYPASHGCVRMTRWDATWLAARAGIGTQVLVYGGTHVFSAGEELSKVGVLEPGGDDPSLQPTEDPTAPSASEPSPSESVSVSETPLPEPSTEPSPEPSTEPSSGEPSASESSPSEPSASDSPSASEPSTDPSTEPSGSEPTPAPSTSVSASETEATP